MNFLRRGGEVVAVQPADVDRHLAHCLAGVQDVGDVCFPADLTDRLGGLDQSRIGRDPAESQQRRAPAPDQLAHRLRVDPALGCVRGPHDFDADSARERQIHDLVGGVIGAAGEDQVAAAGGRTPRMLEQRRRWSSAASPRCVRRPRSGDRRLRTRRGARPPARPRPRSRRSPAPARDAGATASRTAAGCSAAPALLRWITRSEPGVSARQRASSGGSAGRLMPRSPRSRPCRVAIYAPGAAGPRRGHPSAGLRRSGCVAGSKGSHAHRAGGNDTGSGGGFDGGSRAARAADDWSSLRAVRDGTRSSSSTQAGMSPRVCSRRRTTSARRPSWSGDGSADWSRARGSSAARMEPISRSSPADMEVSRKPRPGSADRTPSRASRTSASRTGRSADP